MAVDLPPYRLSRRTFLHHGALVLAAGTCSPGHALAAEHATPQLRIGLLTDVHHADKPAAGSRHYRLSAARAERAVQHFNKAKADMAVCLGDIVDRAELERELGFLRQIEQIYSGYDGPRHYVLGNHCVDTLTKDEFIRHTAMEQTFQSFDRGGHHFIILDACFRSDGQPYGRRNFKWTDTNLSTEEMKWLAADLRATRKPTVVFVHQRLDVDNRYGIKNQGEVRHHLERSGRVVAVFQGHSHKNDLRTIAGIPYITLAAVVEGSDAQRDAYAMLDIHSDGTLRLEGFGAQESRQLAD